MAETTYLNTPDKLQLTSAIPGGILDVAKSILVIMNVAALCLVTTIT